MSFFVKKIRFNRHFLPVVKISNSYDTFISRKFPRLQSMRFTMKPTYSNCGAFATLNYSLGKKKSSLFWFIEFIFHIFLSFPIKFG